MKHWVHATFVVASLILTAARVDAAAVTLSGFLNDPSNTSLVWSDMGAPLFGDDWEIANNVALYSLSVSEGGDVTFDSNGFAAGGIDPYFTLFAGSGGGATFVDSNFLQAFSTGGDFLMTVPLLAGDYTLAIGAFANMSFAENFGAGTLADGFIQLGVPVLGNYHYELNVTTPDAQTVPEPSTIALMAMGFVGLAAARRRNTGD